MPPAWLELTHVQLMGQNEKVSMRCPVVVADLADVVSHSSLVFVNTSLPESILCCTRFGLSPCLQCKINVLAVSSVRSWTLFTLCKKANGVFAISRDIFQESNHIPATSLAKHVVAKSINCLGLQFKTPWPTMLRKRLTIAARLASSENSCSSNNGQDNGKCCCSARNVSNAAATDKKKQSPPAPASAAKACSLCSRSKYSSAARDKVDKRKFQFWQKHRSICNRFSRPCTFPVSHNWLLRLSKRLAAKHDLDTQKHQLCPNESALAIDRPPGSQVKTAMLHPQPHVLLLPHPATHMHRERNWKQCKACI